MKKTMVTILFMIILWMMISFVFHPAEYLFPSLDSVAKAFIENYQDFLENTMYTIIEVIVGFGIAVVLGLFLAIITVHYTHLEQVLTFSAFILKTKQYQL